MSEFKVAYGEDTRLSRPMWRGWRLLPEVPALEFENEEVQGYRIDLDRLTTSAQMLDWIFQIHSKPWGAAAFLGFIEALYDVLNPQGLVCTWGIDRPFTSEGLRERVNEYVQTGC
jgi:hypothetical protein